MKKRREKISKELKELRKLQAFKQRALNKGVNRGNNTSSNKTRKKNSSKGSPEAVINPEYIAGENGTANPADTIS